MYQLFKGYVKTKNKACTQSFKNKTSEQLLNIEQASELDEYAGILNENTVLIDIDDYDLSEMMLNIVEESQLRCRVYETSKGKHFLFLNDDLFDSNKTKKNMACGIETDIKLGAKTSYSVLKFNGKNRKIIYDVETGEDYQTAPRYLLPINSKKQFWTMTSGDGRNQELFNYILTLQSEGFSKEDARETIRIINKFVMKEPMSESELDVILRDDAFQKPVFFEKNTFKFDKFAHFLINEHDIIKIDGELCCFDNGVYSPMNIESYMIKHIPNLKKQQRQEVLSYLDVLIGTDTKTAPANYIAVKNGIYNIDTRELIPYDNDIVLTNKINWDYVPDAYCELVDKVLNQLACDDKNVRLLLEECIGYTFYRRNELRKGFFMKGKRHNGKSTFIDMCRYLLGEYNTSSLDLSDLSHEYKAIGLRGKLANLGDDVEDDFIPNSGLFKKIVSGDRINVNVKYGQPTEFSPYTKVFFSGNTIPRIGRGRDSAAILDRLVIIPMNAEFNSKNKGFDPFIKYKLRNQQCMEYLLRIGIEGLHRVLERNVFTMNEAIEQELVEYEETLNPIITFFNDIGDGLENEPTKKAYRLYNEFCIESSLKPISHIEFSKQVKEFFKYDIKTIRVNGKPMKVFVKKGG